MSAGRRAFLELTTLGIGALGAGALAEGCGAAGGRALLPEAEAGELSARLERGLRAAREREAEPARLRGPRPDLSAHVVRMTMESLVVLDVLRSIPEGTRVPPSLGAALADVMPTLDRCIHTHHALLTRMPALHRRALDRRVRASPNEVMDIAEWIDDEARVLGVPVDNRLRLRESAMSAGSRLRRQSTSAVVDDCTAKLDELFARQGAALPADLRERTARIVDAMWEQAEDTGASGGAVAPPDDWAQAAVVDAAESPLVVPARFHSPSEMPDPTEPVQWSASWARPGDEEIRIGAIMMPFGLVTCGLLLIVGIIVLAVGEAQNGSWDGRTTEADEHLRARRDRD